LLAQGLQRELDHLGHAQIAVNDPHSLQALKLDCIVRRIGDAVDGALDVEISVAETREAFAACVLVGLLDRRIISCRARSLAASAARAKLVSLPGEDGGTWFHRNADRRSARNCRPPHRG
jgi:hypothetical protein